MPLMIQGGEDLFPPLSVLCAWYYLGKPQLTVKIRRYGVEGIQMGERFIPTDEGGQLLEFIPIRPSVVMASDARENYVAHSKLP
jgi:hypothetical protein